MFMWTLCFWAEGCTTLTESNRPQDLVAVPGLVFDDHFAASFVSEGWLGSVVFSLCLRLCCNFLLYYCDKDDLLFSYDFSQFSSNVV